jgi:hypothetical protein
MSLRFYEHFMTRLFKNYAPFCLMVLDGQLGPTSMLVFKPEADMLVKTVLTVLCMAGFAFYVRLLVALCKECRSRSSGYWMWLGVSSRENVIVDLRDQKCQVTRAA